MYDVKPDDAPAHARGRRLMDRAKDEVRKLIEDGADATERAIMEAPAGDLDSV